MKYRLLTKEELEPLNEEFLKYLLVANITPEIWENMKETDLNACEKHIEIFSDLVLDKVLQEISYIDKITADRVEAYHFFKEQAILFVLENKLVGSFNFQQDDWAKLDLNSVTIIQGKKQYLKNREEEVFTIMQQQNAGISRGDVYKKIALLFADLTSSNS